MVYIQKVLGSRDLLLSALLAFNWKFIWVFLKYEAAYIANEEDLVLIQFIFALH